MQNIRHNDKNEVINAPICPQYLFLPDKLDFRQTY